MGSSRTLSFVTRGCCSSLKISSSTLVGGQHHQGCVVLQYATSERGEGVREPRLQSGSAARAMTEQGLEESDLAELFVAVTTRLGQSISEKDQAIAGVERDLRLLVFGMGNHPEHRPAGAQP